MPQRPKLVLEIEKPTKVRFLFDRPRTGNSPYGPWYAYTVAVDDQEYGFFAVPKLHELLERIGVGKGSEVVLTRRVRQVEGRAQFYYTVTLGEQTFSTIGEEPPEVVAAEPVAPEALPEAKVTEADYFGLMEECLSEALKAWQGLGIQFTSDNVQATAATLFIQLCQRGYRQPLKRQGGA